MSSKTSSNRQRGSYSRHCPVVRSNPERKFIAKGDRSLGSYRESNNSFLKTTPVLSVPNKKGTMEEEIHSLCSTLSIHSLTWHQGRSVRSLTHIVPCPSPLILVQKGKSWLLPLCHFLLSLASMGVGGSFGPLLECCQDLEPLCIA